jgi:Ni/Co efflux regulator RcnB
MKSLLLISLMTGLLVGGPVLADKPDRDKGGNRAEASRKGDARHGDDRRDDRREDGRRDQRDDWQGGSYFNDHHRTASRQYYDEHYHAAGRCPPGLAKKRNGCQPPGQAKKWHKGQPLPRGVIFYELPRDMVERMGPPPRGHRYVRVASDILLIAIGTGMVVDAIDNLLDR